MGSSSASAECLRALLREPQFEIVGVVSQPDRPVGRGKKRLELTPCPLAKFAAERGLTEIHKPEKVNTPESLALIRSWKPDVIVVVAYGQILRQELLDIPLFGCVNCHFSLLPKYRGAAPVVAALEAGESMTGVTVMRMGPGLDDGPIMLQGFEPIYPDTTGGALMEDLATAGGVTLAKALRLMWSNQLPPQIQQDEASATYVKKLKKTDGLIDWDLPSIVTERRIRAYNPWPGCYTFLPQRMRRAGTLGRLVILKARIVRLIEDSWRDSAPGTVLAVTKDGPIVRCHDTALLLLVVKPEGSSQMDGAAFVRGRPLQPGQDVFLME